MEKRSTIKHIFLGILLLAGCARETVPEQETVPVRVYNFLKYYGGAKTIVSSRKEGLVR